MAWAEPEYSRTKVDRAGETYIDRSVSAEERELARAVINNWRSSHSFPLNTLQNNLRKRATSVDYDSTIAQRIKRLPAIRQKLERFRGMNLSRMQDLGGCRAVLSSVDAVDELVKYYKTQSRIKHKLVREYPYIVEPQCSGYRGVHLVYSYFSDRTTVWNGLQIEMQIRSRLQHAWATAVETVGTFTRQALKSSRGEKDWLRFFALMSSALAMREGVPLVPNTPHDPNELLQELREYTKKLDVIQRLTAYGQAMSLSEQIEVSKRDALLLELDTAAKELVVRSYPNPLVAADAYNAIERAIENDPTKDVVLVTVESLTALRRAYPNYFLDTTAFIESVEEAIA